jgi:hypothetical protein
MKVNIFLTIIEIVGYTGISMRLPPRAAKTKTYILFYFWKKEKGGILTAT